MAKDLENKMESNNVYLFTQITPETTNELIVQLTQWVNGLSLPKIKTETKSYEHISLIGADYTTKIFSPYEALPQDTNLLNVWINCCGGQANILHAILSLFHIASAKGTIIKTYNIGRASSCASIVAVSGTPGYRYMAQDAVNYIHFGNVSQNVSHQNEIESAVRGLKNFGKWTKKTYLENTDLTEKEIEKYYNIEGAGLLSASQCLRKGLCDWIITNDGRFVNKVNAIKKQKTR